MDDKRLPKLFGEFTGFKREKHDSEPIPELPLPEVTPVDEIHFADLSFNISAAETEAQKLAKIAKDARDANNTKEEKDVRPFIQSLRSLMRAEARKGEISILLQRDKDKAMWQAITSKAGRKLLKEEGFSFDFKKEDTDLRIFWDDPINVISQNVFTT